eukprot:UN27883
MNLSGYKDEVKQNKVPHMDLSDTEEAGQYTFALQKSMWVLPDVSLSGITAEKISSYEYMAKCQPVSCKVWKPNTDFKPEDKTTFRFTKSVIPMLYDLTIQFRTTEVNLKDKKILRSLCELDNMTVHKAILMERTKRDRT